MERLKSGGRDLELEMPSAVDLPARESVEWSRNSLIYPELFRLFTFLFFFLHYHQSINHLSFLKEHITQHVRSSADPQAVRLGQRAS
jgi:hypothetical protein